MAGYILYSAPDEEKNKELEILEVQIKEEEDDLKEEYRKLGEAYFEQNKLLLNVPSEFSELFDAIRARKTSLEQCKERIMSLKKIKICPYCNSEIPEESVFCIMCGKKVKETKPQKLENTVTCKYCGTVLPAGSKFCGYCAHSLSDDDTDGTDLLDTIVENNETVEANFFEDETSYDIDKNGENDDQDNDESDVRSDDTDNADDESYEIDVDTDEEIDDEEDDLYATTAANTGWNAIKICPRCNKRLDRSSKFCTGCGMRLSD